VEKRVAITLWYLATPMEYRSIGHLFGVARCTACVVVHETCTAIVDVLLKAYISFPKGDQVKQVVDGFQRTWGVPQCCGAIDGCHIPISAPAMNHTDYYNRKGFYSVVTQAVVDYQYRFLDVYTGWPGSVHDARVFAHSSLYKLGVNNRLLPDTKQSIGGTEVPLYLIGDSAYPMLTWLMKPFPHNSSLSAEQRTYNYRICRARIVVENAFGRLKARWRRVSKRLDADIDNIPTIITACCILHNMCEVHGEAFVDNWMDEVRRDEQPHFHCVDLDDSTTRTMATSDARSVRNALVQHLSG